MIYLKKIIIIFLLISYPASILKWFLTSNTQNISVIGDLILAFIPVLNIFFIYLINYSDVGLCMLLLIPGSKFPLPGT